MCRSGRGHLHSFADPRGLTSRSNVFDSPWEAGQEVIEEDSARYFSAAAYAAEGLIDLHVSSPMGSFESTPTAWEEWSGENQLGMLPFTYGTNMPEPGGPPKVLFKAQQRGDTGRLPDSREQGAPDQLGRYDPDYFDWTSALLECETSCWDMQDICYEFESLSTPQAGTRDMEETTNSKSNGL